MTGLCRRQMRRRPARIKAGKPEETPDPLPFGGNRSGALCGYGSETSEGMRFLRFDMCALRSIHVRIGGKSRGLRCGNDTVPSAAVRDTPLQAAAEGRRR